MDPLTGFYACCYCCAPSHDIERIYTGGGCENPDRHTVPCMLCGQKVHDA